MLIPLTCDLFALFMQGNVVNVFFQMFLQTQVFGMIFRVLLNYPLLIGRQSLTRNYPQACYHKLMHDLSFLMIGMWETSFFFAKFKT